MVFDVRRVVSPGVSDGQVPMEALDGLSLTYPLVVQFLTLTSYGNGDRRLPGSITVFSDGGLLKACLNDKDADLAAFVSGGGLAGLLDAVERGLGSDCLDWRAARSHKKRKQ